MISRAKVGQSSDSTAANESGVALASYMQLYTGSIKFTSRQHARTVLYTLRQANKIGTI